MRVWKRFDAWQIWFDVHSMFIVHAVTEFTIEIQRCHETCSRSDRLHENDWADYFLREKHPIEGFFTCLTFAQNIVRRKPPRVNPYVQLEED